MSLVASPEHLNTLLAACEQDTNSIDAKIALAQHYADIGWFNQAKEVYKEILFVSPDTYAVLLDYGNVCYTHNDSAEALSVFSKLTVLKPSRIEGWNNLGILYLAQGDLSLAGKAFSEVLSLEPDNVGALLNAGNVYQQKQDVSQAIECFKKAVAVRPDFADGWYNLGNALYNNGQLDIALSAFGKAIRYNPKLGSAHKNLGVILEKQNKLDMALSSYEQALVCNKADAGLYVNIANVSLARKDYDRAKESYLKAIRLSPKDMSGWMGLRACALIKGDITTYVKASKAVLLRLDTNLIAQTVRVMRTLGHVDDALELIQLADKFDKKNDELDSERMIVFALANKDPGIVLALQKRLLASKNLSDTVHINLAQLFCISENYKEAKMILERISICTPSVHKLFWNVFAGLKLWKELGASTDDALKTDPDNFDAYFYKAMALSESGDRVAAKESLIISIEKGFAEFELIKKPSIIYDVYSEIVVLSGL